MKTKDNTALQNDYRFLKILARNNRYEIILASQIANGRQVIIKQAVLPDEDATLISKLGHEYDILKELNHHGIPKVYDFLFDGKTAALVQEFIDGTSLKDHLFKSKLGYIDVLDLAIQLAGILQYLHQNGVVHKDIHPGNLMIAENGQLKLLDFGISSNLGSGQHEILNVDKVEGTLAYISPEQTGRTAYTVSYSSDFYSFGILLYELLAGKPPFDSTDPLEVIHFHLSRKPLPLTHLLPDLPKELEQIVFKLIAKNPDDRYLSASSLKADLELVKIHLTSEIPMDRFKPGANDFSGQYKQTQKLYGRQKESEELLGYFKNLHRSKSMLVLVAGYSGVGKSALIKHVKFPIIQQQGTFISGKFDQFKKDIPYYAFIEAIKDFIKNLLSEPDEKIASWRTRIATVLGDNARLITDVIPQLSRIVGKTDPVPALQPAEQETRFNMVLLDFIYTFSSPENPLVIFLDDLQWADLPSLNLVKRILESPRKNNILIIGSYRDNEVDKGHPLLITLKQIGESNELVKNIHLNPLDEETTCRITADSFGMEKPEACELGRHVFAKTNGNPFFIHSFLKSLYDRKQIKAHPLKKWVWNQDEIDKLQYTDNVIDLMTVGLTDLPPRTREVLQHAAVLGNTFGLADLSDTLGATSPNVYAELKPAILGGFLNPVNTSYRSLVLNSNQNGAKSDLAGQAKNVQFTFSHDKVQQAAYNLIPDAERPYVHLKIGRLLIQNRNRQQLLDDIFEILNHYVAGFHLIEHTEEKFKIAELCLMAGKKAKESTSYSQAVNFLNVAKNLLGENTWSGNYQLTYNILKELGECEYLNDNPAQAEYYFRQVLRNSKTRFEKLQVYYLHSSLYLKMGNTMESLRLGMEAARMYNIHFPKSKLAIQITALFTLMKYLFLFSTRFRNPEKLYHQKDCTDEERIALHKFLIDLATSAYQQDQNLMMLVIFQLVKLYIKDGFTDASGFGFSGFSTVVLSALKMQERGFSLWEITKQMHRKTRSPLIRWRLSYTVNAYESHRSTPFADSYHGIMEMIKACRLNGDQIFTSYSVALEMRVKFFAGMPLPALIKNSDDHIPMIRNSQGGLDFVQYYYQLVKVLNSQSVRENWNDEDFNGEAALERLKLEDNRTKLALFYIPKSILHYFLGQHEESLHESENAAKYYDNILGDIGQAAHGFFTALTIAACYRNLGKKEQKKWGKIFTGHLKDMQFHAEGCPRNFSAHYNLLKAEQYAINNFKKAIQLYEKAISLSIEYEIIYVTAIACERAADLCQQKELKIQQQAYIEKAWEAFNSWGAYAKCKQLEEIYPGLSNHRAKHAKTEIGATTTLLSGKNALDLASVLKASQTIASQVKYEDVLKNLMHITIENAGAEKGCLLLYKGGQLCIEAVGISGSNGIDIFPSVPFEGTGIVPESVINYCRRTEEMLVFVDAAGEDRFRSDGYVSTHKILSVLCLPVTTAGKVTGFLYLENSLLKGTFNSGRIEMLRMLSGQIGISIENSLLYENLEEKVQERTRKITKTLSELKSAQAQLIQSEKMASLGELTAGIAHEIQNPLNFVNNFSEISSELIEEMKEELVKGDVLLAGEIAEDIRQNLEKINNHGKRAADIVKGMLQHSRTGSGEKEATDINALCDEYLRLAYHGLKAKDKSFNAEFKTDFDPNLPKIKVVPQDIGRVLLNLINNSFYAVNERNTKSEEGYKPTVSVSTAKIGDKLEVKVADNGNGIPENIKEKIFQPFFTTKPTGQGTGLGLSLSYDIIKAHSGEIKVKSTSGKGTEFIIHLPVLL